MGRANELVQFGSGNLDRCQLVDTYQDKTLASLRKKLGQNSSKPLVFIT